MDVRGDVVHVAFASSWYVSVNDCVPGDLVGSAEDRLRSRQRSFNR